MKFANDGNNGCDRNLYVDYIEVCGTRIQSESGSVKQNTNWTNGDKQILFTNGDNDYGNLGCPVARVNDHLIESAVDAGERYGEFLTYPNPATDQLTIEGTKTYQLAIYDLHGRLVLQQERLSGVSTINTSELYRGVYLIQLQSDQNRPVYQRVMIE